VHGRVRNEASGVVATDRGDRHGGEKVTSMLAHLEESMVVSQPMVVVVVVAMQ
jgi:hypothetical protein